MDNADQDKGGHKNSMMNGGQLMPNGGPALKSEDGALGQGKLYSFITNDFKKNKTYNLVIEINPDDKYCVK